MLMCIRMVVPAELGFPDAHVHTDGGARWAGPQLDQVAYLVDYPQAVSSLIGGPPGTPGERVGDPALVPDLAEDLLAGVPDVHGAARAGVPQRVRGDLTGREHQVRRPVVPQAGPVRIPGYQAAQRPEVGFVRKSLGVRRRVRQWAVVLRREGPRPRRAAGGQMAVPGHAPVAALGVANDRRRQPGDVVRAHDRDRHSGE